MKQVLSVLLIFFCMAARAQNEITTPSGQPLKVGNNGLKFANLTSASPTQSANGKVLTLDANGLVFLAPQSSSQWITSGGAVSYSGPGTTNVGIGTANPLQKLDVNGNLNISGHLMAYNSVFLRTPQNANTLIGLQAGELLTTGYNNTFIGALAGKSMVDGYFNTFIGVGAGFSSAYATSNVFIGADAGHSNTTGSGNVFVGVIAGQANTTGGYNMMMGLNSGTSNTTGSTNIFLGNFAGSANTTANSNAFIGYLAGQNTTTGGNNTFIGIGAGTNNTIGANNVAIGNNANFSANNLNNAIAIGTGAVVSADNSVVIGAANAKIGFGTSSPQSKLEITSFSANTSGLRFTNLTSNSTTSSANGRALSVNSTGDVVLVPVSSSAKISTQQEFWQQTDGGQIINNNDSGVIVGKGVSKFPVGYNLYVSEGILTERVKIAFKNKSEWSDYVFEPSYKLDPLEKVEQFIRKHGHLPGVPSAKEMVESGNDLNKTDALLLKKIEELTLYNIDQKKYIRDHQDQINELIHCNDQQALQLKVQQKEIDELKNLLIQQLKSKK